MFVRLCVAMTQPTSLYPWQQFVSLLQSHCSCHFFTVLKFLYTQEGVLIIQYVIIVASLVISTEYWMANLFGILAAFTGNILLYVDFWLQQFIELNLEDL